ncbi:MazG-like family protein [Metallumcola ferriviriculae]|uniref:MazG-like family protein n=1 Tax=Metallumcola ferriviriculae TaxID=3039180 RepID=A0AAU0UN80_9FIRM|nr:MazG-like family protein [Desulfitibacteraceae bacterium MK1]
MSHAHKAAIARNIRVIEELKAELVTNTAAVLQSMAKDDPNAVLDSLAGTLISTYLLSKKLNVDFEHLDKQVVEKLHQTLAVTLEGQNLNAELNQLLEYLTKS